MQHIKDDEMSSNENSGTFWIIVRGGELDIYSFNKDYSLDDYKLPTNIELLVRKAVPNKLLQHGGMISVSF